MINMAGMDWQRGPEGGIYLMGHDTSAAQVARGGGGLMGSQKIRGWSGGRFIPGDVKTTEQALALTGLDWDVRKQPIIKVEPQWGVSADGEPGIIGWTPIQSGDTQVKRGKGEQPYTLPTGGWDVADSHVMNVRTDTGGVLGVVGPQWTGVSNQDAFRFVDDLVDSGDAKWLGGGEKNGGSKVWMCAQLDRGTILGGDENEMSVPLMFITNGWDGGTSYTITAAPYRLACLNGQSIPLEGFVRTWRGRHTSGLTADARLAVARKSLELTIGYFDAWAVEMEKLMTAHVSTFAVENTVKMLFPDATKDSNGEMRKRAQGNVDRARDAVLTIFRHAEDLQHLGSTKYRLLNAVTEYADWHVKGKEDAQVLRSAEANPLKDRAYALLTSA